MDPRNVGIRQAPRLVVLVAKCLTEMLIGGGRVRDLDHGPKRRVMRSGPRINGGKEITGFPRPQ